MELSGEFFTWQQGRQETGGKKAWNVLAAGMYAFWLSCRFGSCEPQEVSWFMWFRCMYNATWLEQEICPFALSGPCKGTILAPCTIVLQPEWHR